jgi:peptidoglycan hydrolase-like protein with peptidoglycan-binding domain
MKRRTKAVAGALAVAVALGGTVASGALRSRGSGSAQAATTPTTVTRVTAKVTRQDLIATTAVGGTLTYGTAHAIRVGSTSSAGSSSSGSAGGSAAAGSAGAGTAAAATTTTSASLITALPALGAVIGRGQQLFELNGGPGPALLYGSRPMWRTLTSGVSDGVDVLQLEQNLAALGFTDSGSMVVDSHFTAATTSAINAWQLARGVTETGSVAPGAVVYDSGPVRVSAYVAAVGDSASGTIYDVTGTTRTVQVALDPANQAYVTRGAHISVTLPDGNNVDGVIHSIGTVATVSSSSGNGGGGGGNTTTTTTIPVTIVLPKQPKDALDDSPVTVNLVSSRARKVLTVPVNALLALAEGGYALEKVNVDGSTTLVRITPGMFANGFVEVTGNVSEGETVVSA